MADVVMVNILLKFRYIFCFTWCSNSQAHIAMGNLWVEEPVHTSWSRFYTTGHRYVTINFPTCGAPAGIRNSDLRG